MFTELTRTIPELPEPYNNLAVLYAGQGDYDKARKALEMAIRTHPSYAVAHENLGDIYATLASQAYDKALQLDSNNATARKKLALIKELFPAKTAATLAQAEAATSGTADTPASKPAVQDKPTGTKAALQTASQQSIPPPSRQASSRNLPAIRPTRCSRRSKPGPRPGPATTPMATSPSMRRISRRPTASRARIGRPRAATGWPNRRKST